MSDTPEHARIVDNACLVYFGTKISVQVGGEHFTLGEISALAGDFYKNPEDLEADSGNARRTLSQYGKLLTAHPDFDATCADHGERDKLAILDCIAFRGEHFIDLAVENQAHFVLGRPGARTKCMEHHKEARRHQGEPLWNALMLHEGFALHFLVDMFAAGHMRTPRAAIERYLAKGDHLGVNPLAVAASILPTSSIVPKLPQVQTLLLAQNLIKKRGYDPENAKIIGALLSLAQHNHDNAVGLSCNWFGPLRDPGDVDPRPDRRSTTRSPWLADPSGFGSPSFQLCEGNFTGDGSFHALELTERAAERDSGRVIDDEFRSEPPEHPSGSPDPRQCDAQPKPGGANATKHLYATIVAQVLDAYPALAAPFQAVPWPRGHGAFLDQVAPRPVERDKGYMTAWELGDDTIVYWNGPRQVVVEKWIQLKVETDEEKRIKYVTLQVGALGPKAQLLVHGAAATTMTLPVHLDKVASMLEPMDGNDPRVRDLFDDAHLASWLIKNGLETWGTVQKDAKKMEEEGQEVLDRAGKKLQEVEKRAEDLGQKGWDATKAGAKAVGDGVQKALEETKKGWEETKTQASDFLYHILEHQDETTYGDFE